MPDDRRSTLPEDRAFERHGNVTDSGPVSFTGDFTVGPSPGRVLTVVAISLYIALALAADDTALSTIISRLIVVHTWQNLTWFGA